MGRMDDSEVRGEGSWHTKWFGSLEVIQCDRRRLPGRVQLSLMGSQNSAAVYKYFPSDSRHLMFVIPGAGGASVTL